MPASEFVGPERKKSLVKGAGVQYLPGHDEPLVDRIVQSYVIPGANCVDLGGGGFRFAVPAALKGAQVLVVDLDPESLDLEMVIGRVSDIGKVSLDPLLIRTRVRILQMDVFDFLRDRRRQISLLTAFRLVHFFTPEQVEEFFSLTAGSMVPGGLFVFSALYSGAPVADGGPSNDIFQQTKPVTPENIHYREWKDDEAARRIQTEQNLSQRLHFFDEHSVGGICLRYGFEPVELSMPSTRVARGFVLRFKG